MTSIHLFLKASERLPEGTRYPPEPMRTEPCLQHALQGTLQPDSAGPSVTVPTVTVPTTMSEAGMVRGGKYVSTFSPKPGASRDTAPGHSTHLPSMRTCVLQSAIPEPTLPAWPH